MHCRVEPDPAVKTTFCVITLDKATRTADNAINRQPDIISISKDTFNPVINLKGGTAYRALGFTLFGFNTSVQTEWAGQVFVALRQFFFAGLMHLCLSFAEVLRFILK
jgi:hypothetical protein